MSVQEKHTVVFTCDDCKAEACVDVRTAVGDRPDHDRISSLLPRGWTSASRLRPGYEDTDPHGEHCAFRYYDHQRCASCSGKKG